MAGDAGLHRRALGAERGIGAGGAAEHGNEHAGRGLLQPFGVAQQFVDPTGDLEAERGWHGVLAVGAGGDWHLRAALRQIRHRQQRFIDQALEDGMRLAQHQQISGLGDVLRCRAPMHPAAMRFADDMAEFPDQRHQSVAGAGEAFIDAGAIHQCQLRLRGNGVSGVLRNDSQFRLGVGERGFDIEPGLPAAFLAIKPADAGIGHPGRGGEGVAHARFPQFACDNWG